MKKILLFLVIIAVGSVAGWYVLVYKDVQVQKQTVSDLEAQKQTVSDIKNTGAACSSWASDLPGIPSAKITSKTTFTIDGKNVVLWKRTHAEMTKMLIPSKTFSYIQNVPTTDGWGNIYEYYVTDDVLGSHFVLIRSPGKDGVYSGNVYDGKSTFNAKDYDKDIVWIDDYFAQQPKREAN